MNNTATTDRDFLMTSDAARELGVARETVLLWERTGRLPAIRTQNGRRLFRRSDVERVKREREAKVNTGSTVKS
jgi:excisionase family DNA binding protein